MSRPTHSLAVRLSLWATDPDYIIEEEKEVKGDDASIAATKFMVEAEGFGAFKAGKALWENPYNTLKEQELFVFWRDGWLRAERWKETRKVKEVK